MLVFQTYSKCIWSSVWMTRRSKNLLWLTTENRIESTINFSIPLLHALPMKMYTFRNQFSVPLFHRFVCSCFPFPYFTSARSIWTGRDRRVHTLRARTYLFLDVRSCAGCAACLFIYCSPEHKIKSEISFCDMVVKYAFMLVGSECAAITHSAHRLLSILFAYMLKCSNKINNKYTKNDSKTIDGTWWSLLHWRLDHWPYEWARNLPLTRIR